MEFHFELSRYDSDIFRLQVSKALEKRTESVSREKYPMLWNFTDKLNSMGKVSDKAVKKRRSRYKLYGILLLLIGLFLLIPSLTAPREMLVTLLAGLFAALTGILYFRLGRKTNNTKPTSFDKAAELLFTKYKDTHTGNVTVIFTDNSVKLAGESFAYEKIERFIITEDLFILFWDKKVAVLQKKDLSSGKVEEFIDFVKEKVHGRFEIVSVIS